jgi:hypothetical protein
MTTLLMTAREKMLTRRRVASCRQNKKPKDASEPQSMDETATEPPADKTTTENPKTSSAILTAQWDYKNKAATIRIDGEVYSSTTLKPKEKGASGSYEINITPSTSMQSNQSMESRPSN